MKLPKKAALPIAVLTAALLASTARVVARPQPKPRELDEAFPLVEVVIARPAAERMTVHAQGTLEPRTETALIAEAGGRVVWISPALDGGGAFQRGEVLARLAAEDQEIAAERARAAVERADSQLALARAVLARSQALLDAGATSSAAHEQASGNERIAAANLRDAEALRRQAELDLARTRVRAPFAGRVRERLISLGELVGRGTPVARVYGAEAAEVRLALRGEDAAFLALPAAPSRSGPRVTLSGGFAGSSHTWAGRIVRSEGALDPRTRMLTVVARVEDPLAGAAGAAPRAMGMFVEAEIEGREIADVVRLPRAALIGEHSVAVVDAESKLRVREVKVLRVDGESAWIAGGLAAGERVCAHAPSVLTPGATVRTESGPASPDRSSSGTPLGSASLRAAEGRSQ